MRSPRLFILMIAVLFCTVKSKAQDTGFVYRDTSIVGIDSVQTNSINMGTDAVPPGEDVEEAVENAVIYVDTSLTKNNLAIEPDSITSLKKQRAFAYARNLDSLLNAYQEQHKEKTEEIREEPSLLEGFFLSKITRYFFWSLAVFFICFILYKLFFAEGFFQRSYTRSAVNILDDQSERLSPDADYSKLIAQAVTQKNYRLAIRYYYLQSLQKLTAKGLIEFAPDKTNHEYLRELTGKKYKNEFAALTLNYEYAWYGEFDISETIFESVQQKFKHFNAIVS